MKTRSLILSLCAAFAVSAAIPATPGMAPAAAQTATAAPSVARVPFGVREKASYRVSFKGIGVGKGSIEVAGLDTVRGVTTYHLVMKVKGGIPFARIDDTTESWLDVQKLISLRFHQKLHEVNYKRDKTIDFFPSEMLWAVQGKDESGPLATKEPLDDVSFIYWVRTIPLEVGKTYTFNRYFKAEGNPVVVKVLRRERIKVPHGTFNTIVLQPLIKTKGLFSEGGEAQLYFSDDERRMLVMMTTKLSIGSMKMQLEGYEAGQPLTAADL